MSLMSSRLPWSSASPPSSSGPPGSSTSNVSLGRDIDAESINTNYHQIQKKVDEHKVEMTQLNLLTQKAHHEIQNETLYLGKIIHEALSEELKLVSELQTQIAKLQNFRKEFDENITRKLMQITNNCNVVSERLVAMSRSNTTNAITEHGFINKAITQIENDIIKFTADIIIEEGKFKTLQSDINTALKGADLSKKIMNSSYNITGDIITKSRTMISNITTTKTDLEAFRDVIHSNLGYEFP